MITRKIGNVVGRLALAACCMAAAAPAAAQRVQTGSFNGLSFTAQSTIVGQTSTGTRVANGDPTYHAPMPQKSGVTALILNFAGGSFICSGSLLSDRRSVLTAAHCATDATGARPTSVSAYFYGGGDPDTFVPGNPLATEVDVSNVYINPLYTGDVIDQHDIAVVRLADAAPAFATAYELYDGGDLTGLGFTVDGYGGRSTIGGAFGVDAGTGRLREGENRFDFRFGDATFDGFFTDDSTTAIEYSWLSDFDNGSTANDSSCALGGIFGNSSGQFCNTGLGKREVGIAGGDSGGPQFIDGKIASVTSYGIVFGGNNLGTDFRPGLNSSWGEFGGYAPVAQSRDFLAMVLAVPEPDTWLSMILGFGFVGAAFRRRSGAEGLRAVVPA